MFKLNVEPWQARDLAHHDMRGLVHVVGHLHRQHAALRQRLGEALELRKMIRHPLEDRIGEQHVRSRQAAPNAKCSLR
jgi:hypothetical protein